MKNHTFGQPSTTWIHQICRDTHGWHSDWGTAAGGGQTILVDNCNGERLRLNASRQDDDDDDEKPCFHGCVLFQIQIDLDLLDEIDPLQWIRTHGNLSGHSGRGHLVLVCAERHRRCPILKVNKLCRRPAAQMGVAKSDFSQKQSWFDYEHGVFRSDWSRSI